MIHDVQFFNPRPTNTDESIYGSLRLTGEQGRLLGLRHEQTVRGVLDPGGNSILLNTDSASYRLALTTAYNPNANLIFKAWVTPQGVILQPLRHSVVRQPKAIGSDSAPTATAPLTDVPARLSLLARLQTPLSALAALNNPQAITQMLARVTNQANAERAIEHLWQSRDALSATSIKMAIGGSGLLNVGASAAASITLKKILEQLKKNSLENQQHSDLLKLGDLDDAIDYLESTKLHGLLRQESGELFYRFPLLLFDAHPVDVRIIRERQPEQGDPDASWRIDLDIPLGENRHVDVSLQLLSDATVNVVVWTTDQALLALMKRETTALGSRFSDWDIALGNVQMVYGERPLVRETLTTAPTPVSQKLDCYT